MEVCNYVSFKQDSTSHGLILTWEQLLRVNRLGGVCWEQLPSLPRPPSRDTDSVPFTALPCVPLFFSCLPLKESQSWRVLMRKGIAYHTELAAVMDWKCARLPGNTFLLSSTIMVSSCACPHFYSSTRCLKPGVCSGKPKGHYGLFGEHSGELHRRETSFALTSLFGSIKKTNNAFGPLTHTHFTLLIENTGNI